ncbi:hypothetical protein H072_6831 [Dactylellina haptotyla CBS 200.50]|uniref:Uncharacterized protein n=1 Tax=Dactylellina haptotyla (strain CBS 200.50) TaxID=1284197 RepID=S8AE83_DACHA|nr:hypothetical protein H072_6831 [Dactylellina haptotyla CBS 200.50]
MAPSKKLYLLSAIFVLGAVASPSPVADADTSDCTDFPLHLELNFQSCPSTWDKCCPYICVEVEGPKCFLKPIKKAKNGSEAACWPCAQSSGGSGMMGAPGPPGIASGPPSADIVNNEPALSNAAARPTDVAEAAAVEATSSSSSSSPTSSTKTQKTASTTKSSESSSSTESAVGAASTTSPAANIASKTSIIYMSNAALLGVLSIMLML